MQDFYRNQTRAEPEDKQLMTKKSQTKRSFSFAAVKDLPRLFKIFRYILPYKWHFLLGLLVLLLSSAASLVFPYVIGLLVDAAGDSEGAFSQNINSIALGLIGILIFMAITSFLRVVSFAYMTQKSMADIRNDIYQHMLLLGIPFFEKRRVGELTSRITADVSMLEEVLQYYIAEFVRQGVTMIFGLVIIAWISPRLTITMLVSFPPIVICTIGFGYFLRRIARQRQDAMAEANVVVEETLQSISDVKAFTNEAFESRRYAARINEVVRLALKAAWFRAGFSTMIIVGIFGGIVIVLWRGATLIESGELLPGQLISFMLYTLFIAAGLGSFSNIFSQLLKAVGATDRIEEILVEKTEIGSLEASNRTEIQGDILFENVSFSYPGRPEVQVIKDFNLELKQSSKIALVGQSGAGKSTIPLLLMRFYELEGGQISIGGKSLEEIDLHQLRHNIGIVPQEVILFGGSISENILYGKPGASHEEVREAARQANALEFIENFPEGFETIVGDRGIKLSGGQRQRIAIARAILKNPSILVMDEATSSLDAESEKLVQSALDLLMENRTTIIIAHRLATIRNVDCIYVLQQGEVVEKGTHEELLLKENGVYQNLLKLQFDSASLA